LSTTVGRALRRSHPDPDRCPAGLSQVHVSRLLVSSLTTLRNRLDAE